MSSDSKPTSLAGIDVETVSFPAAAKPPGSTNTLFLGGAGVRGLEIQGKFIKFTAIGVYLEDSAVPSLAVKWKGKTAQELTDSVEFFRDIVTGPFEKFTQVTMILPLTGSQYSEKVTENCVAHWKSVGAYTDAEARAVEKFLEVFKDETFPPGSSILFTQSPLGSLTISFSKDGSIPEASNAVIENKQLSEAVLESIIGKHGWEPEPPSFRLSLRLRPSLLHGPWSDLQQPPPLRLRLRLSSPSISKKELWHGLVEDDQNCLSPVWSQIWRWSNGERRRWWWWFEHEQLCLSPLEARGHSKPTKLCLISPKAPNSHSHF